MQHVSDPSRLRAALASGRQAGRAIALVPTMGNLHAGHLRLIEVAQGLADTVVVSIFVNPLQFNRADDFATYPRTLEQDLRLLAAREVNLVFTPTAAIMYPQGQALDRTTYVTVPGLGQARPGVGPGHEDDLEGQYRPGHFVGVATVVCKLFNMVQPDLALFGEKDYQQLLVIERMVADLNLPIQIHGVATVREDDGLAMSSRNGRLSAQERAKAPALYRILSELATTLAAGDMDDLQALIHTGEAALTAAGLRPEYVGIRRCRDLAPVQSGDTDLVILAAAWLGQTRLIDNILVPRP